MGRSWGGNDDRDEDMAKKCSGISLPGHVGPLGLDLCAPGVHLDQAGVVVRAFML